MNDFIDHSEVPPGTNASHQNATASELPVAQASHAERTDQADCLPRSSRVRDTLEGKGFAISSARDATLAQALVECIRDQHRERSTVYNLERSRLVLRRAGASDDEVRRIESQTQIIQLCNNVRDFFLQADERLPTPTMDFIRRQNAPVGAGSVLDIGCSAGRYLLEFADEGTKHHGLDIDAFSLSVGAAAWQRSRAAGEIQYVAGSALDLPYPDSSMDIVTSWVVLGCVPLRRSLEQVHRVLKPEGVFMFTVEGPGFVTELWDRSDRSLSQAIRLSRWRTATALFAMGIDLQDHPQLRRLAGLMIYPARAMERYLTACGFSVLANETLTEYKGQPRLLGIVARKCP
jgi:SAM-dependent methyltransferase